MYIMKIIIVITGIGTFVNIAQLTEIACDPESQHYFQVSGLSSLNNIVGQVALAITCSTRQNGRSII